MASYTWVISKITQKGYALKRASHLTESYPRHESMNLQEADLARSLGPPATTTEMALLGTTLILGSAKATNERFEGRERKRKVS